MAIVFIKILSGPAKGTIEQPKTGNGAAVEINYLKLDGQNFSLSYPDKYRLENSGQHAVNILESYRMIAPGSRGGLVRTVAVTVYDVPGSELYATSAYKARKDNPSEYKEEIEQINGQQVHFMNKIDIPETVAFIQKGSMVAAIGFSGGIAGEDAQAEYERVIDSWQWK